MQDQKTSSEEALRNAIVQDDLSALKHLLDLGVDPGMRIGSTYENDTALHIAAYMGRMAICQVLLERGASVDGVPNSRSTPLHQVLAGSTLSISEKMKIVELLLQHGANSNASNARAAHTPLHVAITYSGLTGRISDWSDIIRLLLSRGADPSYTPAKSAVDLQDYLTPFQYCVANGQVEHLQVFLREYGVDPRQKTIAGRTMLQLCPPSRAMIRSELKTHLHTAKTEQAVQASLSEEPIGALVTAKRSSGMSPL
jgi:ankyrin repeat protein